MAHHHGAAGHDHTAGANTGMLAWALALTATYLVAEVIGGFVFNSLALLSDAAHMMTDVTALVIALLAIRLGAKPADDKRTFGYRRFEILAAAFNAVLLFGIAIYVLVEAIGRFNAPQEVQSWGMMTVAAIGLVVNLVSMRLLTAGKDASLNIKGAYLEVWADMIGSVGVVLGAGDQAHRLRLDRSDRSRRDRAVGASAHLDIAARYRQHPARRRAGRTEAGRGPHRGRGRAGCRQPA